MNRSAFVVFVFAAMTLLNGGRLLAQNAPSAGAAPREVVRETTVTRTEIIKPPSPFYVLGRGIANVVTCPLEIPRCMIYDNACVPILGFVGGAIEGPFLTVFRALGAVVDIGSLGFSGKGVYSEAFPDFVFQARWVPKPEEKVVVEKTVETIRVDTPAAPAPKATP